MVVATIRVLVPPNNRRELVQPLQSLLVPVRDQKGCLSFRFYFEIGDEDALCLIEEWERSQTWIGSVLSLVEK